MQVFQFTLVIVPIGVRAVILVRAVFIKPVSVRLHSILVSPALNVTRKEEPCDMTSPGDILTPLAADAV